MTIQYQVAGTRRRRVVAVSPAARPELRLPELHPVRRPAPGRVRAVSSCKVATAPARSPWLAVKVAVVSLLAVVGGAVSVTQLVGDAVVTDPAVDYVAGDPAWAHVTQP